MKEERCPKVLKLWNAVEKLYIAYRDILNQVAKEHNLNSIQAQILVTTLSVKRATTSSLSERLMVSKATVSQNVSALEERGLAFREINPSDKRVHHVLLTQEGKELALKLREEFARIQCIPEDMSELELKEGFKFIFKVLDTLHWRVGVKVNGFCYTCKHFRRYQSPGSDKPHFCELFKEPLGDLDIRLKCPHYEPRVKIEID